MAIFRDPPDDLLNPWLTPKQVAKQIGRSEWWLYIRRRRFKDGPPWHEIGCRIFYRQSDIDNWIQSCRRT